MHDAHGDDGGLHAGCSQASSATGLAAHMNLSEPNSGGGRPEQGRKGRVMGDRRTGAQQNERNTYDQRGP